MDLRDALRPPIMHTLTDEERAAAGDDAPIPVTAENLVAGKIPLAAYLAAQHQLARTARTAARARRKSATGLMAGDNIRLGDYALRVQEVQDDGSALCCPISGRRPDLIAAASDVTETYADPIRCGKDQLLIFPRKRVDAKK